MRGRATLLGVVVLALLLSRTAPSAQAIPPQSIENQVLGWIRVLSSSPATQSVTVDHRVFSVAQLSLGRLFANWMQASYLPKASLGDVFALRNERLSPYNQNTAAWPQRYGNLVRLYTDLKYGANKKIEPASGSAVVWTLEANGFYGIAADAISTPDRAYFTLPTFAQQGYGEELDRASSVSGHPVLGQFPTFLMRDSSTGNRRFVLLSRDRRLPFVTVTRGQYLDAMEVAITRKRAAELKRITEAEQGNERRIAVAMADVDARTAKRMATLATNREKYKNRLQETAEISTDQPDVMLENYPDVFEHTGGSPLRLPVYTFDPRMIELSRTDAPQWLVMSWTADLLSPASRNLHRAILDNVNFQYIYDYFFDPARVKGQSYTPLRPIASTGVTGTAWAAARPGGGWLDARARAD